MNVSASMLPEASVSCIGTPDIMLFVLLGGVIGIGLALSYNTQNIRYYIVNRGGVMRRVRTESSYV